MKQLLQEIIAAARMDSQFTAEQAEKWIADGIIAPKIFQVRLKKCYDAFKIETGVIYPDWAKKAILEGYLVINDNFVQNFKGISIFAKTGDWIIKMDDDIDAVTENIFNEDYVFVNTQKETHERPEGEKRLGLDILTADFVPLTRPTTRPPALCTICDGECQLTGICRYTGSPLYGTSHNI